MIIFFALNVFIQTAGHNVISSCRTKRGYAMWGGHPVLFSAAHTDHQKKVIIFILFFLPFFYLIA
jgi:hypothetical protein